MQLHKKFLMAKGALVIGDLNSNKVWDEWDRWWNHSDVVRELDEIGLGSCYHGHFKEEHGAETQTTFYLHKNPQKKYHIDYAFAEQDWELVDINIGPYTDWIGDSDHMPMMIHLQLRNPPVPRITSVENNLEAGNYV